MRKAASFPMFGYALRAFRDGDAAKVDELALAAFDQFRLQYSDWPAMASAIGRMSVLADTGEIIAAERDERIIGAVAYIAAGRPKAAYFDQSWPIIRMLVVDPGTLRRREDVLDVGHHEVVVQARQAGGIIARIF